MKLIYNDVKKHKLSSIYELTQGEDAVIRPDDRFKIEIMFDYCTSFHNGNYEEVVCFSFQENKEDKPIQISPMLVDHKDKTTEEFTIWAAEKIHDLVWEALEQEDERHKNEVKRLREEHFVVNSFRGRVLAEQKAGQ